VRRKKETKKKSAKYRKENFGKKKNYKSISQDLEDEE